MRRTSLYTADPAHEKWIARYTVYDRAALGDMSPSTMLAAYDGLPQQYQTALRKRVARIVRLRVPPTRADLMTGAEFWPRQGEPLGAAMVRRREHDNRRPVAETAATLIGPLSRYLGEDSLGETWTDRARAAAQAEREELAREQVVDIQAIADLDRLAVTTSALTMMTWTEAQTRRAADIMAALALADARAVHGAALRERETDPTVIVPAVPMPDARTDGERDLRDLMAVPVDRAAWAAADARRAANRAEVEVRAGKHRLREARRDRVDARTRAAMAAELLALTERAAALGAETDRLAEQAERVRIEVFGHADVAKRCRAASVRGAMRRLIDATDAHVSAVLGLLGGPKRFGLPSRVSDWSMARAKEMATLNRDYLSNRMLVLREQDGAVAIDCKNQPIAFSALSAATHGAKIAKSQRYAMCLGIQQLAESRGWTLILLTTTLPPRWHPHPTIGRPSYDPDCDPIAARDELQRRCHRALALCSRRGIRFLAPRAREGQVDGTPHDHLAAFVRPDHVDQFIACFAEHFPEPREIMAREAEAAGDIERATQLRERLSRIPRNKRVACHARVWEAAQQKGDAEAAGTIASYIFGYASKSMADAIDGDDDAARNAVWAHQRRVRRWAVLGFRRGIIGQWQRIQRETEAPACPVLRDIWQAMQEQRWGDALDLMDATRDRDDAPIVHDYEEVRGLAGVARRVPIGLRAAGPAAEVRDEHVLMLGLTDGFRYAVCSVSEWKAEQNGGRPMSALDHAYELAVEIARLTPEGERRPTREPTAAELEALDRLEDRWLGNPSVAVIERFPSGRAGGAPTGADNPPVIANKAVEDGKQRSYPPLPERPGPRRPPPRPWQDDQYEDEAMEIAA